MYNNSCLCATPDKFLIESNGSKHPAMKSIEKNGRGCIRERIFTAFAFFWLKQSIVLQTSESSVHVAWKLSMY